MDFFDIVLLMCMGNTAGWLAWIYWPGMRFRLLVDVAAAVSGALIAGYVFRMFYPVSATIGLMIAGTIGALMPLIFLRLQFRRA